MICDLIREDTKVYQYSSYQQDEYPKWNKMKQNIIYDNCVKIKDAFYYFKGDKAIPNNLLNELIGEILATYVFRLPSVHYHIGYDVFLDKYVLLSKNFKETGKKYYTKQEMRELKEQNSSFSKQQMELFQDMKKLAMLDFYCQQSDRHEDNFCFEKKGEEFRLSKLFDYECSFPKLTDVVQFASFQEKRNFIEVTPEELVSELKEDETYQQLFALSYRINLSKVLDIVSKKWKLYIPEHTKEYYLEYQNEIRKQYQKLKLI
ncbi:MAG: hypothetical protein KH135_02210 [Firmicutes bacterium]|nr:hypothetical protein [Bacillota bacterium]